MSARVLIVDDSATIRRALEMILKPEGFELQLAATGKEALERAASFDPELILLDYVLPDMRGPDVCAALEEIPRTQATPVVLVSAKGTSIRQAYEDARNVVSYITKPFKPKVVLGVVTHALAESRRSLPAKTAPLQNVRTTPHRGGLQSVEIGFRNLLHSLEETASQASRRDLTTDHHSVVALLDTAASEVAALRARRGRAAESLGLNARGQIVDAGAELVSAHAALCQASLLLARAHEQHLQEPVVPSRILASTSNRSVTEKIEAEISASEQSRWLFLYGNFETLPHLTAILNPEIVLLEGPSDATLDHALGRLPTHTSVCRLGSPKPSGTPDADRLWHESISAISSNISSASPAVADLLPEVIEL